MSARIVGKLCASCGRPVVLRRPFRGRFCPACVRAACSLRRCEGNSERQARLRRSRVRWWTVAFLAALLLLLFLLR